MNEEISTGINILRHESLVDAHFCESLVNMCKQFNYELVDNVIAGRESTAF